MSLGQLLPESSEIAVLYYASTRKLLIAVCYVMFVLAHLADHIFSNAPNIEQ